MKLLVIGNGFDLAHGLPTRYTDFLKYCRDYDADEPVSASDEQKKEFAAFCGKNIWLSYFLKITPELDSARTWIDFEKEIAGVIREIEEAHIRIDCSDIIVRAPVNTKMQSFLSMLRERKAAEDAFQDTPSLVRFLYLQLRDFTRAFEIYCLRVNKMQPERPVLYELKNKMDEAKKESDFYARQARNADGYAGRKAEKEKYESLRREALSQYSFLYAQIKPRDYLGLSGFDYVLSFNYTNTYERFYGDGHTKYCYIHGKAQENPDKTNLIFGIDDALTAGEESKNFKWVSFKKYYQRIIFRTGSEYKDWLGAGRDKPGASIDTVFIVGHSLDQTDYDVLYEIFFNPNFKIIVYYYSPADFEDKVQKVIRLLAYKGANGRDELIRRVHGSAWSIRFADQYDEEEGLFART